MSSKREAYDFLIVGGGIFGIYAALYLAKKGQRICLVEKERALLKKASIVNQARLHSGYHYPRSVATALMSNDNKARFTSD
ncbi:MAG TPA: FAD-dependent oxidoreductase, partial [Saprospiraceae bacterium]|nr:FAD-dependent oxidoreductase [Saprospiraceae bacterium]